MKIFSHLMQAHKTKGEHPQRSIDGLLSSNLGQEVHGFANLDHRPVLDGSINLQRNEDPHGEAHPSLQTSLTSLVGPEQPNAVHPNDATIASGEGHSIDAGRLPVMGHMVRVMESLLQL